MSKHSLQAKKYNQRMHNMYYGIVVKTNETNVPCSSE